MKRNHDKDDYGCTKNIHIRVCKHHNNIYNMHGNFYSQIDRSPQL